MTAVNSLKIVPLARQRDRHVPSRMAYPDYPIERYIRSNVHDFQLAFAEEAAAQLHDRYDDALLEASRDGLLILARNEQALKSPTAAIGALYPWQLQVGVARVRYREGDDVEAGEAANGRTTIDRGVTLRGVTFRDVTLSEPVMRVTVSVPRQQAQAILDDLAGRTDRQVSLNYAYDRAVIVARVRLARMLGYADLLEELTRGECSVQIHLSEYAPVESPDGPAAA